MTAQAIAPQGVEITLHGDVYHVDHTLQYLGLHDGMHRWTVYGPSGVRWREDEPGPRVLYRVLPGRTSVGFAVLRLADGFSTFAPDPAASVVPDDPQ